MVNIDRRHFKLESTTKYKDFTVIVRKGNITWIGEILDPSNNSIRRTRLCESDTEAVQESIKIIDSIET